jgi:choline dehydrogenase-like flavoprotein
VIVDPRVFGALARTVVPPGQRVAGADEVAVDRLLAGLAGVAPGLAPGWRALAVGIDAISLARTRRRFADLPLGRRLAVLERLDTRESTRNLLRCVVAPLKLAAFDDPAQHAALGCRYRVEPPPAEEPARWREQVHPAESLAGQELACDVVVVGTGAGGAPLAASLAEKGLGVVLLEEGAHHGRAAFTGRPVDMMRRLYRRGGATVALGNTIIPIPLGRGVGGTTLINSGTCFRLPETTLAEWRERSGIDDLTADGLAPWYAAVERDLEVAPSSPAAIGRVGDLVARGCDALGWSHHPLARNAPGCDGQGLCCFGCPTDAKRSTNVSYVPAALSAGAMLVTGARVERVLLEGGRAVGVEALASSGRRLTARARAVVLACGALCTPVLLQRQRLGSREVGRNLSIHPATAALGVFDEEVGGFAAVPQGYGVDEFHDEGLLFEGSSLPLELTAAMTPGFGPAWTARMEEAQRCMLFGFLVKDTSRGRVVAGPEGEARVFYWLNAEDRRRVRRGLGLLARLFLAAGAREVVPPVKGFPTLRSIDDVRRLERTRLAARHVDLTAYHPVGTCRMGVGPGRSVVDADHAVHGVPGLYVSDASVFPGAPGVNPQLTIMALALRAAERLARSLA